MIITRTGFHLHAFLTWNHDELDGAVTLRVLRAHKSDRGAISLDLARADSYVFGDDNGAIRVPDAVTSRWTRRLEWACAKLDGLPRVTLKGLRHTHATLLLELGEHPKVVQERLLTSAHPSEGGRHPPSPLHGSLTR